LIIKKSSSFVDTAVLLPTLLNLISQYHESSEGRVNLTASPPYVTEFDMRFRNAIIHKNKKN